MAYLEELLPEFRKGARIRRNDWKSNEYICLKGDDILDEFGVIDDLSVNDIKTDNWEFYHEPIDWDYIIKNKCLCWFWDDEPYKVIGLLNKVEYNPNLLFYRNSGDYNTYYHNCRPVYNGEVTFYDKK